MSKDDCQRMQLLLRKLANDRQYDWSVMAKTYTLNVCDISWTFCLLFRVVQNCKAHDIVLLVFHAVGIFFEFCLFFCCVLFYAEKYGITPERPHSSVPVEDIIIEAARQLPLYFSRFFVVKVSGKCQFQYSFLVVYELNQFFLNSRKLDW